MKIFVFGTGSVANLLLHKFKKGIEILAFVNSDTAIKVFNGYKVVTPDDICKYDFDYILIASGYYEDIEKMLLDLGIDQEKIVGFIFDNAKTYQELNQAIDSYLNIRLKRDIAKTIFKDDVFFPEVCGVTIWKNNCFKKVYKDFVREQTVNLLAQEIERKCILGDVAELGVFKGDFTIIINKAFPTKKLYLFDTFNGFTNHDIEEDNSIDNKEYELQKFKDTSEELVLSRLEIKECDCEIKKGFFPDTFDLWNNSFCFVSIDLNLRNPVEKGLEIFYPRMAKGGYIMISDYNAPFYEGTRNAVQQYCDSNDISYMPIPDLYGSVIIMK